MFGIMGSYIASGILNIKNFTTGKSNVKQYDCSIFILTDNQISQNTKCKFKCTCPSFKYEFETILYMNDALIGEPRSKRLPKKRTGIFICKHLFGCINILENFNTVDNIMKHVKGEL